MFNLKVAMIPSSAELGQNGRVFVQLNEYQSSCLVRMWRPVTPPIPAKTQNDFQIYNLFIWLYIVAPSIKHGTMVMIILIIIFSSSYTVDHLCYQSITGLWNRIYSLWTCSFSVKSPTRRTAGRMCMMHWWMPSATLVSMRAIAFGVSMVLPLHYTGICVC